MSKMFKNLPFKKDSPSKKQHLPKTNLKIPRFEVRQSFRKNLKSRSQKVSSLN